MVAAAVVGPSGRVTAMEASPLLFAVTSGRPVHTGNVDVDVALERVEVDSTPRHATQPRPTPTPSTHTTLELQGKGFGFGRTLLHLMLSCQVLLGEHTALLTAMPTRSADVVYFDPMFRRPTTSSSGFETVLRGLANSTPLSNEALVQARRVAKRCVVVMDQPTGRNGSSGNGGSCEEDHGHACALSGEDSAGDGGMDNAGELERLGIPVTLEGQRKRFGVLNCAAEAVAASVIEAVAAPQPWE